MGLSTLSESFLPVLGEKGVDAVKAELDALANNSSGWKKSVVALLAANVEQHGPDGIKLGIEAIQKLVKDGTVPDFTGLSIAEAGELTAVLHDLEDKQRSDLNDFLVKVSKVLGTVLSALIKSAL